MQCTGWLDGVPEWLGGSGDEWTDCCRIHDLSDLSIGAAVELGRCVAASGYPLMGLTMMLGLVLFGWLYQLVKRRLR